MDIQAATAPAERAITEGGGVDPETGKIGFPQTLVAIPVGSAGLSLDVILFYDNLITEDVVTWNSQAPTGPAGLGWALDQRTIFRDTRGTGTTLDDRLYLLDGEIMELTPTAQSGTTWTYQAKTEDATLDWEILYFSAEERWTVVKPDSDQTLTFGGGVTSTIGQKDSAGHSIEWAVRYGGWMGSTAEAEGEQFAVAWNLHTVEASDGASLIYVYQQAQTVTGRSKKFTQASYVSSITASTGPAVAFIYAQKDAGEIPPNTGSGKEDPYQFRYQSLYLAQLVVTEGGTTRATVDLTYTFLESMSKRLLAGIGISADSIAGTGPRTVAFTYYGTDPADGVTVTWSDPNGIFNATTQALYGSLKSMTSTESGVTQEDWLYRYGKVTVSGSERMADILPLGQNVRVFYGPDYLVIAVESVAQVIIQVYEWDNTWQSRFVDDLYVRDVESVDDIKIALSEGFFVVAAMKGATITVFRRDGSSWRDTSTYLGVETDEFEVAAGDNLFGVLDVEHGKLYRGWWTGQSWDLDGIDFAGGSRNDYAVGMTANRGFLFTAEIAEGKDMQAKCRLFYLDPLRQWQEAPSHTISQAMSGIELVTITPGEAFVLVDFNTDPLVSDNHTYALVNWGADYSGMSSQVISSGSNTQIAVAGSSVNHAVQGVKNMYRYNGSSWIHQSLDNLYLDSDDRAEYLYPDFTLAVDNTAGVLQKFKYYSYSPEDQHWSPQNQVEVPNEFNLAMLKVIALAAKLAVKLALLAVPRPLKYVIKWSVLKPLKTLLKAVARMHTSSGIYQYQDTGSAYVAVGTTVDDGALNVYLQRRLLSGGENEWVPLIGRSRLSEGPPLVYDIMSQVDSFVVWMTAEGKGRNWVTLLRNGQIVPLPDGSSRLTLDDESSGVNVWTIPDEDQPLLYTPDFIVAYQPDSDNRFRNTRTLRLVRVIQDGVSGPLSDFVISSVTDNVAAKTLAFDYDEATAVFDVAAGTARFPR